MSDHRLDIKYRLMVVFCAVALFSGACSGESAEDQLASSMSDEMLAEATNDGRVVSQQTTDCVATQLVADNGIAAFEAIGITAEDASGLRTATFDPGFYSADAFKCFTEDEMITMMSLGPNDVVMQCLVTTLGTDAMAELFVSQVEPPAEVKEVILGCSPG